MVLSFSTRSHFVLANETSKPTSLNDLMYSIDLNTCSFIPRLLNSNTVLFRYKYYFGEHHQGQ
ncbi:MAG: hypothetical protein ACFCU1_09190, partial [Sumerlaeia bacterium]